ncbi:MAG TPA: efflux RND transporter periplasmic adaptor subunit [Candidatus Limnocylindrales bacterium]|nr:efflux RND transporter periplasmic adaptor subunit [Candidatus Limnocylindrales bacterium]
MAKPNKRRKIIIFSAIGLVLIALVLVAVFKKRAPVITVQTEKVSRHSLTNIVVANGQIQPVVQVTISPEVNGEIIELPVKEGQQVKKGDLLVKINPDVYIAAVNQAKAGYESALATKASAAANLEKAEADYRRNQTLFSSKLLSESDFVGFKAARDVARAQLDSADDQVNVAKAQVDNAEEQLSRTTISSPLTGTITDLNAEVGERVLGTTYNMGTSIMTVSDLNRIEARVDVGEIDVVGIAPGEKARLEVDAFKDRKFTGVVTAVANSALGSGLSSALGGGGGGGSQSQQATQFEVRIRVSDKEPAFRPGMSVTAEIETEYRTNALTVPLASVTTRPMKPVVKTDPPKKGQTNAVVSAASDTNAAAGTNALASILKNKDSSKPTDVVFVVAGDHVKTVPVKIGICDDNYWEITDGLTNGEEIVSGGYRAVGRDLQDDSKIRVGPAEAEKK